MQLHPATRHLVDAIKTLQYTYEVLPVDQIYTKDDYARRIHDLQWNCLLVAAQIEDREPMEFLKHLKQEEQ